MQAVSVSQLFLPQLRKHSSENKQMHIGPIKKLQAQLLRI